MISFDHFTIEDEGPIYAQIIKHIKREIIAGIIQDQDEMPSRRMLSVLLGVNPNTIQKAYRLLEAENIITSHSGAKSYVTLTDVQIKQIKSQQLEGDAKSFVLALKQMGISKEEAIQLISRVWD
ncbi:GntR family transcriptional regulator [Fusibacter ferrireducens]|uniref:GntR family transcriptional regulator n=1 Tax=Fusibacter ferrireducens TaxID=2785058 RepID=A0ABR9ZZ70_9FIRM|nr:GntR family transcriptional regulator [Fusibacter ferrireducens]MBF4695757.1 GntR family transcriptional regulator [Fusibacter ferrireducens]